MKTAVFSAAVVLLPAAPLVAAPDYPIRAAEMTKAKVTAGFWFDRLETNRLVTLKASNGLGLIPYCLWGDREPGNEMQCWFRTR